MNLKGMASSPTPSTDSLSGGTTLGSFVDSHDLGLGLDINHHGCHGSSSSSSTCSSIVFPHLSLSNGIVSNHQNQQQQQHHHHQQPLQQQHSQQQQSQQHGMVPHGILSPTRNGGSGSNMGPIPIKCSLCHETYNKPKVLPCLHTFCQDCLEKAQDTMDRVVCPSCRMECPLSSQGVDGLLPDYALNNLVHGAAQGGHTTNLNKIVGKSSSIEAIKFGDFEDFQLLQSGWMDKDCTSCKSKESNSIAIGRCHDCENFLCSNCVMAHQFMHCFEGHRVVCFAEPGKENGLGMTLDRQVSCTQHKGETLQFYCLTCAVPACPECVLLEHPKSLHETEPLQDCEAKYVKHLSQYIQDFRMKSVALHDVLKSFETASVRLQNHYSKAQNEVSEAFTFYRNLLDERKGELMKELENLYITRQVTLSVVTQRVQETLDRMYQTVEFGERLLRHASPPQILVFKKLLETRLQALLAGVPEPSVAMSTAAAGDLEFVTNYTAVQAAVRNTLGYIRTGVGTNGNGDSVCGMNNQKLPPQPIARPPPIGQVNGYQQQQQQQQQQHQTTPNGINNGLGSSLGGNHSQNGSSANLHDCTILSKRLSIGGTSGGVGGVGLTSGSTSRTNGNGLSNGSSDNYSSSFNQLDVIGQCSYEKWSIGNDGFQNGNKDFSCSSRSEYSSPPSMVTNDPVLELTSKLMTPLSYKSSAIKRQKMIYHCKFGEFGTAESQFTEPSGVAVNANNEIIVADTNNHRIQIFDRDGRFKFQFGECGKRDGQLLYPNRVAVVRPAGDIVVTERSPTHQIQIYNQYGQFVRKFGANILQHPRGITVDNKGRIIVVECKVMRVIIFDQMGTVLHKFGCSKHLEFPNGVVVNDSQEIFISDNRAHCVKVFSYEGTFLRQIGGEGLTNYPIGVGINSNGEILVADNHNNFNLTIFTQDGQLVSALESKVKHAQCFDVALMDDGSVVLASKDYRLYIYRYIQVAPLGM